MNRESGQMLLTLALALSVAVTAAIGLWSVMHGWRKQVALQLRLDRCSGETALRMVRSLREAERINLGIHAARAGVAANLAAPPAAAPFRVALKALVLRQEWLETEWRARQLAWIARRGCSSGSDIALPLPAFPYSRLPADILGENILVSKGASGKRLLIHLRRSPRRATAVIEGESNAFATRWKTRWTSSLELLGSSAR